MVGRELAVTSCRHDLHHRNVSAAEISEGLHAVVITVNNNAKPMLTTSICGRHLRQDEPAGWLALMRSENLEHIAVVLCPVNKLAVHPTMPVALPD